MNAGSILRSSAVAMALLSLLAAPSTPLAQIPGENVNMVTGTQWPGGDPFLQRQNEPSLAVSSANPQHLLAGANDYRSVDLPYPFGPNDPMKMPGDAWLGVFKSYNGGQTWQSVLMPGFPQDTSALPSQGANSPLRNCVKGSTSAADRCTSAADPVVRAGTHGMLYYSGIAFKRGTSWGKVFISRFIDLNNKENGDPTRTDPNDVTKAAPTDPIRFVDQVVIASSDGKVFLDKPWIAIDKPRLLSQICKITAPNPDGTTTTKTFQGGAIYASWIRFAPGEVTSDVMFSSSRDCGKTWAAAIKLNDATSSLNQAPGIAIDPFTGFVYVTWRRFQYPAAPATPTQKDSIMVARSFRGYLFTKPRVVADFTPFEQGSTSTMVRTNAFPSIAISVDKTGYNGWVHIAWPQRMGAHGDSRVVTSTAPVLPPPWNGLESSDPCNGWTVPVPVDDHGLVAPYGEGSEGGFRTFTRGHQFMPTLTFSQGKLVVLYYDSRFTHTASVFKPNSPFTPDPLRGSFYREERVPIAPWNPMTSTGDPEDPANVFKDTNDTIDDAGMQNVRHTVEVRVGTSGPGKDPVFTSEQVSKYRFGERGDEPPNFKVPQFLGLDASSVSSRAAGLAVTDADSFVRLQQFDVNPPNLPMFKNGTVPFLGDYIDIQGPAFENGATGWAFATAPRSAPVFHAVWTTNQDVRAPKDGDWTHYTPMKLPGQSGSIFNPGAPASQMAFCTPGTPGNEGTRNQNIYTARITEGLLVSSPQNVKPLSSAQTRSFVVVAHNDTSYPKAFRFSFTGVAPASCSNGAGQAAPTSCASFSADSSVPAVDVEVLPHSSVTRSLFVRSTSVATTLTVNVNEVVRPDPTATAPACSLVALNCAYVAGGLAGFVTLNPPGSNPALVPPDGSTTDAGTNETIKFANVSTANVSTANVSTANVSTANVSTANISTANVSTANVCTANVSTANVSTANVCTANVSTANVSTANVSTANVSTANVTTANISTANVSTANVSTANVSTANVSTANVSTANVSTANVSTANVSTAPVSDLNYEVTNTSNTTTSYSVQFVCEDPAGCPTSTPLHLMVNKFYVIPASTGCQLVAEPRAVLVANAGYVQDAFVSPTSLIDPKTREGAASNATLSLAPGEKAQITLRGRVTVAQMADIGTRIAPAVVPHSTPLGGTVGGSQTYGTSTLVGLPTKSTQTTVTAGNGTFTATVVGVPTTTAIPTGKVTFIVGGTQVLGIGPLDVTGRATLTASIPVGASLVAYYGGDTQYKASSGSYATQLATTLSLSSDTDPSSVPGQAITLGFHLSAPYALPGPTGAIQLFDGATPASAPTAFVCSPSGGLHHCNGAFNLVPPPGNHVFTARYTGDAGYLPSTSGSVPWSVTSATVTVTAPSGPILIGQPATFAASVTNAASQAVRWSVVPSTTASIGETTGVFQATAAATYVVTATSTVDTAATGEATLTIAPPSITLSPGATGPVSMLVNQERIFTATVTGIANPVVTWSVSPPTEGVTITQASDTTALLQVGVAGNYTVTATAPGVTASASVVVTAPVSSALGIKGWIADADVDVSIDRDAAPFEGAVVTVTGPGGAVLVPQVGPGRYRTNAFTLPGAGQTVAISVTGAGITVTGSGVVPPTPTITAPAAGSVISPSRPLTVSWSNPTSTITTDSFFLDGLCGAEPCMTGAWATAPGTASSATTNSGLFPSGQTVHMALFASKQVPLTGSVLASSSMAVNARAPVTGWWDLIASDTLVLDATAAIQGGAPPASSSKSFNVSVKDQANQPVPSSQLAVTLTSSANPTNVMTIPAYLPSGEGQFSVGDLAFDPGDTVTLEVVRTDPATAQVVARTTGAVVIPGFATMTSGTASAGTATVGWSYEPGLADPNEFWFWYAGQPTVPSAVGNLRVTSFPVAATPPFTIQITSVNTSTTFTGNGAGVFASRTDDNVWFPVTEPFSAPPQRGATIAAGGNSSFFVVPDGTARALGQNNGGQLGTGQVIGGIFPIPETVRNLPAGFRSIDAAAWYGMAIDRLGSLWVWGYGPSIGQPSTDNPAPIEYGTLGTGTTVTAISAGYYGGLALRSDGLVFGFGNDAHGQLGPLAGHSGIRQVAGLAGIVAVAAGEQHSLALGSDGTVWALGENAYGQLGDGTTTPRTTPRRVGGLSQIVAIAAGSWHSVALRADGAVLTWGHNANGQLGDGTTADSLVPVQVPGPYRIDSIATGNNHTLALSEGGVLTWGANDHGQLGDGTFVDRSSPVLLPLSSIREISGGEWHSMASNGSTVYAWGWNAHGQLGAAAPQLSPTPAPFPMMVISVSPASATVTTGQSLALTATVTGVGTPGVYWLVSPFPGADVSDSGVFLATVPGTYTVTATSLADPTVTGTATVTVLPAPPVALVVSPNPAAFAATVVATLQIGIPPGGPDPTGTVTFGDQIHTATSGATGFAPVTTPVVCFTDLSHLPVSRACSASATLPAWHLSGLHTVIASYGGDANYGVAVATADVNVEIPTPVLEFTGTTARAGGKDYNLRVANWTQYPVEAFASQAVHPCGANGNASRTWMDIHDGATGAFLYGFCAFTAPTDLQTLWFHVQAGSAPPSSVKVRATDWVRNVVVESAPVALPVPVTVIVDPPTVELTTGGAMGFVAIVTGTANTAVTWSVREAGGGTVSATGAYTAPATPGTYHVVATSTADPTAWGEATATVTAPVGTGDLQASTSTWVDPNSAGLGYTVTLVGTVVPVTTGGPAPTGAVTFREFSTGAVLGTAPLESSSTNPDCDPGYTCASLRIRTDASGLGIPSDSSSSAVHLVRASYAGDASYVAGEDDGSSELVVQRTNVWRDVSSYPYWSAGAVGINGVIYVFGGLNSGGSPVNTVAAYAADGGVWWNHGTLPIGPSEVVAAVPSGKAYVFRADAPPQEYDTATGSARVLPAPMPTPRDRAAAVGLPDGRILVAGGVDATGVLTGLVEVLDTTTETWATVAAMPTARSGARATHFGGKVYVVGGSDAVTMVGTVEIYDLATGTWSSGPSLSVPRRNFGLAASGGKIFAVGGGEAIGTSSVEVLDLASPTAWSVGPSIGTARGDTTAVTLDWNGAIYLVGGMSPSERTGLPVEVLFP